MKHSNLSQLLIVLVTTLLLASSGARADIQTALTFPSGTTLQAGGSLTFDFGISFIPLPATTGTPQFVDDFSGTQVASCSADPGACAELQFNTTASTLVPNSPVFAEVLAHTTPTQVVPTFYPFSALGTYPLTFAYPDPGVYEITVAGAGDQEQFSELECVTPWDNGAITGPLSCSSILTIPVNGNFDPNGTPDVFVTVNPAAPAPEPASLLLMGTGLLGLAVFLRRKARAA